MEGGMHQVAGRDAPGGGEVVEGRDAPDSGEGRTR